MVPASQHNKDGDCDTFSPESPLSERTAEGIGFDNDEFPRVDDNGSLLGVIVDRFSFDDDDELTIFNGRDALSVIHRNAPSLNLPQHNYYSENKPVGGVVMKNGKVRRKMRWKPRFGKKKKNNLSSNASVISALTSRSVATSRSTSTTRSFLSHFSKKSNTSFHTFHSTETPKATNRANRPQAPHTVMRPNYKDSFTTPQPKYATIDTEGTYIDHRERKESKSSSASMALLNASSASGFLSTALDSVQELPGLEMSQDVEIENLQKVDGVDCSPPSPIATINVSTSSNSTVSNRSAKSANSKTNLRNPPLNISTKYSKPSSQSQSKSRRPPLFKRRLRQNKTKSGSSSSINNNSSNQNLTTPVSPTDTNSTAPLSPLSLERENSGIPVLMGDDYEQDRRISILEASYVTPKSQTKSLVDDIVAADDAEEFSVSPTVQSSISGSHSGSGGRSVSSDVNSEAQTLRNHVSSSNEYSTTSAASSILPNQCGSEKNIVSPPSPGDVSIHSTSSAGTPPTARRLYGKKSPVENYAKSKGRTGRGKTPSVPCDLDEGAFLEAEHNLRAIHNMAAEHLAHGEFEEAADVFEEILRGQEERYGQDHYRVGTALHNLGIVYMKKGDFTKAVEICKRAVDVRKDSLIPNHPDVAVSLAQLGVAHLEAQNNNAALSAFRDALHIRQTLLGPRHAKCSKILNNMGCALYSMEDFNSSKRAFDEALEIQREALRSLPSNDGTESNGTQSNTLLLSMASTLCNIGSIRLQWKDFEKATVALEEALLIQQSVLEDEHPVILSTLESIELVEEAKHHALNPFSHAEVFVNRAVSTCTEDSPAVAVCTDDNPAAVMTDMTEMLGIDNLDSISPRNWFVNPCGQGLHSRALSGDT